jgi:hypothetical protein
VEKRNKSSDNAKKHAIEKYGMTAAAFDEDDEKYRSLIKKT